MMKNTSTILDLKSRLVLCQKLLQELRPLLMEGYSLNPGSQNSNSLEIENKTSFRDIVTKYDKEVEAWITLKLQKNFPGEGIIGEETCALTKELPKEIAQKHDLVWVLDPIDGTTNFSRSYPFFCTTWCLIQKTTNGHSPILALTYNPVSNECFWAIKGHGSWINGLRLRCTSIKNPKEALFVTGFASLNEKFAENDNTPQSINIFKEITASSLGVRRDGSAALDLAYVAAGRVDGYWEWGLSVWDIAAGVLLCEEAGGIVTHHDGSPIDIFSGEILSSNPQIHPWLLQKLR